MSSSSDIEKLFDHFGGDANAYQEIGRENEARSARTRWPLLVTLDLTQPAIPAIGQRRAVAASEASAQDAAPTADLQDTTPKDAASVTRAKTPLFTRSHRRDIPPVVVTVQPAASSGASRFGAPDTEDETAPAPHPEAAPAWVQAPAPAPAQAWAQAQAPAHTHTIAPAAPKPPASILGKLFAPEPTLAPPRPAAPPSESAPLQSVFDRLRGTATQAAAVPAGAPRAVTPAASNSWLINGPRRS
ncbi:hypothetical protein AYM40_23755 [Paraburkholderia phytofirmans OLGA172]|uniref:Cellulose biosynthesis protein BcsR n=1 Tax=Paraburkholderia phytofirmans OLGA172 TaxID=1417228 RepID=A0A160FRH8_9BURK|nr:cellulose biosynthesis protein BcsP [Paraburkholderia phytofirmans]ANB75392.1 hypothetical protein AYM40_23755 [Paraburkholderia phytofirmans OLGA172]